MDEPSPEAAARDAISHWSRLSDLAGFATLRHGFGDGDGGFGVAYPGDLDEYDRVIERRHIPGGFVEVYGHFGPPGGYGLLIPESLYLAVLGGMLADAGLAAESERVRGLLAEAGRA